jgi:hypothetical protein
MSLKKVKKFIKGNKDPLLTHLRKHQLPDQANVRPIKGKKYIEQVKNKHKAYNPDVDIRGVGYHPYQTGRVEHIEKQRAKDSKKGGKNFPKIYDRNYLKGK